MKENGYRSYDRYILYPTLSVSLFLAILVFSGVLVSGCASTKNQPFDYVTCMDTIPKHVTGLKIIQGPRSERSIIADMVAIVCQSNAYFSKMQKNNPTLSGGTVVFRVTAEYTGEVLFVAVEKDTGVNQGLAEHVSEMIMNHDLVGWMQHDGDTVFLYPITFY